MKIVINNLKKRFGDNVAVDIPSLSIEDGEIVGLVGNNGAGKTTLFRLIVDLLKADFGDISLMPQSSNNENQSINPAQSEMWKHMTGVYIDSSFLIDFLTAEEYFEFVGKASGVNKSEMEARLEEFCDFMNGEILGQGKYIRDMSAGNKQKVGIIAALLNNPEFVILDEPFNFLDPSSQNKLKKMLINYNKSHGATMLVSSHNLTHTVDISSRVVLLEHGVVVKNLDNADGHAEKELEDYFNV